VDAIHATLSALMTTIVGGSFLLLQGCSQSVDTSIQENPVQSTALTGAAGLDARPKNATCLATTQPKLGLALSSERVFPDVSFDAPLQMLQAPADNSRWFIAEQSGVVKAVSTAAGSQTTDVHPFLDLTDRAASGDAGWMDLAFDPQFAQNGRAFVAYVAKPAAGSTQRGWRLSRFARSADALDAKSESILFEIPLSNTTSHTRGAIGFGPDRMLYVAIGDGVEGNRAPSPAQSPASLLGKLIRIDVRAVDAYRIPADNPFANENGIRCPTGSATAGMQCAEIYASGFHDPQGLSFEGTSAAAQVWLGDGSHGGWEEVNRVTRGGNYGWPLREGTHCAAGASCPAGAKDASFIAPFAEYPPALGSSVTNGFLYRGHRFPWLVGRYVFGDFGSGRIFAVRSEAGESTEAEVIMSTGSRISALAEGRDGELYYANHSGTLHALTPGSIKAHLSETGCVNPSNPAEPAPGLVPYEVAVPFWSDGASKSRWMAVPDGSQIKVEASGDLTFPKGTVFMKSFTLNGSLIETRLLMRHTDTGNWGGYTYRWNASHTDATLVADGQEVSIGKQTWIYMRVGDCIVCHNPAAGDSLGLKVRQLNTAMTYPSTSRSANQLGTLVHIGMFSNAFAVQAPYPDPHDTSLSITERARSYLQTNCSNCHRPGGNTGAQFDLRYSTPIDKMNICDAKQVRGSLGVEGERIVAAGKPEQSILWLRMGTRSNYKMPPLGSHRVDEQGVALLHEWIRTMRSGCRPPKS